MIAWLEIFDDARPAPPASEEDIARLLASINAPLSEEEIGWYSEPHLRPRQWALPPFAPPEAHLDFLRFSNGGEFSSGDKYFQFFAAHEVRATMLDYYLPEYWPLALPFALDGGGTFYAFDMRQPPVAGEFPVVAAHAGSLSWDERDCWAIAGSFLEACRA